MEHKYLLGLYDDEETLLSATKKIKKAGYQMHEVYTPFPVHGLDIAMGLQDTRLHTAGFLIGACGALFAILAMGGINVLDWPIVTGGKPYYSFPAYVPIAFEITVLSSAVGMTVIYYIRNRFSVFKDPEIVELRSSDDRFTMAFCLKKYSDENQISEIKKMLSETGAVEVKERHLKEAIPDNDFSLHPHDDDDEHHH